MKITAQEPMAELPWALGPEEDPPLRRELRDLIGRSEIGPEALERELRKLERANAGGVYSELIHLLTHVRIDHDEARRHWECIVDHRRSMQQRLESTVDLRVAMLDFFVTVRPRLKNPKVIEMSLFDQTQAAIFRDELTGLYNYRFFNDQLEREIARADRGNSPLSLAILDVDDFKRYNDVFGHAAGNRMLADLGGLLARSLRREDLIARFGGEEFAVIFPSTAKAGARVAVETLRDRVQRHHFGDGADGDRKQVTLSAGIATFPADAGDAGELLRNADRAMYQAKSSGKNRVRLFAESSRSHRRLEAALEGRYRPVTRRSRPLKTLRISGGGLLFVSDHEPELGSLLEVDLSLPPDGRRVSLPGRVISIKPRNDGPFEVTVTVEGFDRHDRSALGRYVRGAEDPERNRAQITDRE